MSKPLQDVPVTDFQLTPPTKVVISPDLLSQLESTFKSVVNNAVSKLEFSPSSMKKNTSEEAVEDVLKIIGESNELDSNVVITCPVVDNNVSKSTNVATSDPATHKKPAKLKTSIVIGEQYITLELPKPCLVDEIDMDKLPSVDQENNLIVAPMRRLTYRERLKGWSVELRERENYEKFEKFYHHPQSRRIFRSVNEVVKFILYEDYPGKPSHTQKEKKMKLVEGMGNDMTTEAQRMKRLCKSTSSVDHRSVQEITRNVVDKTHKDDNSNPAENAIELEAQRSMPKQLVNIYQSYREQLEHTWQKEMVADSQSLLYQLISSAKLPQGVQVTDNAFNKAQALAVVPISIYKPNEDTNVTTTSNIVVHRTSKITTSIMVEDMPITAEAPTIERICPSTSNDDRGR